MPEININPYDGLRVRRNDRFDSVVVELRALVDGEPLPIFSGEDHLVLLEKQDPSPRDLGDATRLQLLAEAMARFVNTGGYPGDIFLLANLVNTHVPPVCLGDYVLVSSDVTAEVDEEKSDVIVNYEHYFVCPGTQKGFLLSEDQFSQPMSIQEYKDARGFQRTLNTNNGNNDRTFEIVTALLESNVQAEG